LAALCGHFFFFLNSTPCKVATALKTLIFYIRFLFVFIGRGRKIHRHHDGAADVAQVKKTE
jgi:hypothetical protein